MTTIDWYGRRPPSRVGLGWAFFERQTNLWKRYWAWELVWLVYGVVNTLAITFIANEAAHRDRDEGPAVAADDVPADRHARVGLPVGHPRRHEPDDHVGALGGDHRAHVDGAGPARRAPGRHVGLRDPARPYPDHPDHGLRAAVLPRRPRGSGLGSQRPPSSPSGASAWSASGSWPVSCRSCTPSAANRCRSWSRRSSCWSRASTTALPSCPAATGCLPRFAGHVPAERYP